MAVLSIVELARRETSVQGGSVNGVLGLKLCPFVKGSFGTSLCSRVCGYVRSRVSFGAHVSSQVSLLVDGCGVFVLSC